jgi:hypothetical protein
VIDEAIAELTPLIGVRAACRATGRPQANHYRRHRKSPRPPRPAREPAPQPRALLTCATFGGLDWTRVADLGFRRRGGWDLRTNP